MFSRNKTIHRKAAPFLLVFVFFVSAFAPCVSGNVLRAEETFSVLAEETYDESAGQAVQAGSPTLTHVAKDGDVSGYLAVAGRANNWDGVDYKFADYGMETGKTYRFTVEGRVPADAEVPEGAQAFLQIPMGDWPWLGSADYAAGESFTLSKEYTWEDDQYTALRVMSNEEGKTVPFNIESFKLELKDEPAEAETPAGTVVAEETFDESQGNTVQSGGVTITHTPKSGDQSGYVCLSGRENNWDALDVPFASNGMEINNKYRVTVDGHVAADTEVPEGGQFWVQVINGYALVGQADFAAGESFTANFEYEWTDEEASTFRLQTNEEAKAMPFCLDGYKIEHLGALEVPEEVTYETVAEETFDESQGNTVQSGSVVITHTPKSGDQSGYVCLSGRENNWDALDVPFASNGMEINNKYRVTVDGHVAADTEVPEGGQFWVQVINGYALVGQADFAAGESFTVTFDYEWTDEEASTFRLQTNEEAKAMPFCLDDYKIEKISAAEQGEEEEPTGPVEVIHAVIDFEDGTEQGFVGRGGVETLEVNTRENHTENGQYSLHISGREKNWNGPSLNIEDRISAGGEYKFTARIKSDTEGSITYKLSTQIGNGSSASYNNLDSVTIKPEDGWALLEGTYRYNSIVDDYVTIYIESDTVEAQFYIDDITIDTVESDPVKADMSLKSIQEQYADMFLIGNAVSNDDMYGEYLKHLKHHHDLLTCGNAMKPDYLYNAEHEFDFSGSDVLVNKILDEGFKLHGHVLVWHSQSPSWLWSNSDGTLLSREQALANMKRHIRTVMQHYGNKVISWDVVNEALDGDFSNPENWRAGLRNSGWKQAIGDDYIYQAFKYARQVLDENGWNNITLFYNDYNDDQQNKAATMYYMIKEMNETYKAETGSDRPLVSGVGMQSHYNMNTNPENVRRSIDRFRQLGIEIGITELDVTTLTHNTKVQKEIEKQAQIYANLFAIYKENADIISRVTFWGINDPRSWRADRFPLVFDEALKPKLAYDALMNPEQYLEEHGVEEDDTKLEAKANFGTPLLGETRDPIWDDQPVLKVNQYQAAWEGATAEGKVLWDNDYLYILMDVTDPVLDATAEAAHEQDSVEIFINESGKTEFFYIDGVGQYRINYLNEGSFNPADCGEGVISFTRQHAGGYEVETAIPWKTITPENGSRIGFDLQVNDGENGSRISVAAWNDQTGQGYQDPSVFGWLDLVKEEEEPVATTTEKPEESTTTEASEEPVASDETKPSEEIVETDETEPSEEPVATDETEPSEEIVASDETKPSEEIAASDETESSDIADVTDKDGQDTVIRYLPGEPIPEKAPEGYVRVSFDPTLIAYLRYNPEFEAGELVVFDIKEGTTWGEAKLVFKGLVIPEIISNDQEKKPMGWSPALPEDHELVREIKFVAVFADEASADSTAAETEPASTGTKKADDGKITETGEGIKALLIAAGFLAAGTALAVYRRKKRFDS